MIEGRCSATSSVAGACKKKDRADNSWPADFAAGMVRVRISLNLPWRVAQSRSLQCCPPDAMSANMYVELFVRAPSKNGPVAS